MTLLVLAGSWSVSLRAVPDLVVGQLGLTPLEMIVCSAVRSAGPGLADRGGVVGRVVRTLVPVGAGVVLGRRRGARRRPAAEGEGVVEVRPGWEKYADERPVTSICRPMRDGLLFRPHADRKADGIWT